MVMHEYEKVKSIKRSAINFLLKKRSKLLMHIKNSKIKHYVVKFTIKVLVLDNCQVILSSKKGGKNSLKCFPGRVHCYGVDDTEPLMKKQTNVILKLILSFFD